MAKISQAEWGRIRRDFLVDAARRGASLSLRDRVWAVTPAGEWVALPGTSDSPVADRWWLGCDPEKLRKRTPVGIVLLCQARGGPLYPIGLPATLFADLESQLSRNVKQVFFNVTRRGERFLLQLRGGEEVEVTEHLNDISWAAKEHVAPVANPPVKPLYEVARESPLEAPHYGSSRGEPENDKKTDRFFATAKNGALHPLDEVELEAGSIYLVQAQKADAVPATTFLRRILARGGPSDLPPDFAERHDFYRHSTSRR